MMKRPYTGFIREVFTYSTYLLRPKRSPKVKFLIFTSGRSGSNLLVSLINSHPSVHCENELLWKRVFSPSLYIRAKEQLSTNDVYGFKLLSSHFEVQRIKEPKLFVSRILERGYKIINLRRHNTLRQAISHLYASYRGKFHHFNSQGKQEHLAMWLELGVLQMELEWLESLHNLEDDILCDLPYLRLYYEDDLASETSQSRSMDRIYRYLGIPPSALATDLIKTTPDDLSKIIKNYDEVIDFIQGTKYDKFLKA